MRKLAERKRLTEKKKSELSKLKRIDRCGLLSTPELQAVAKIEASLLKGVRRYFEENGFVEVIVPHLTKATGACENVETMFILDYFGRQRYLTQTGQLYLEILTPSLKRVWCIGPSFRAEPRVDDRHLTEFTLVEMEFNGNLKELIGHIENIICTMIREVIQNREEELKLLEINKRELGEVRPLFKRITYTEAVQSLSELGIEIKWGDDLKAVHEKTLVKIFGDEPLFITHFPKEIKFFNMKANSENPNIVNSADLVLPFGGEAAGAAEREHEYASLYERLKNSFMLKQLIEKGGSISDFRWYLDFYKKYGGIPHAGCGIGLNRVTQFVLKSDDIRTTTVFPLNKEFVL